MEKIKERAEFNYPYISEDWLSSVQEVTAKELIDTQRESYIIGATEQRQIDIEKAYKWFCEEYMCEDIQCYNAFKKYMLKD